MPTTSPNQFPTQQQTFLLAGPAGDLEVLTTPANESAAMTVVICHPHPLQEGTMYNKVVTTMARAYKELGMRAVRFNYRGVGKSQGEYGNMLGEMDDLRAILTWVETVCPDNGVCLAGFSFGSFISASVAQDYPVKHLLNIAPAVNHADFANLANISCPWLVVQGEADEVVPATEVFDWLEQVNPAPALIRMPNVGHFFHGQLIELREQLKQAIAAQLQG